MYGRSDMSVAYYGCKITPGEVEGILFGIPELARRINAFALVTSEDSAGNKRLAICLELATGMSAPDEVESLALSKAIYSRLAEVNQDFRESIRMVSAGLEPTIEFHAKAGGPFTANDIRVKCRYVQERHMSSACLEQ
jgi:phenylacetate-CoA ligase